MAEATWVERLDDLVADMQLIRTPDHEAYAIWRSESGPEHTTPIDSTEFQHVIRRRCYTAHLRPPPAQALKELIQCLEARALVEGEEADVFLRVGGTKSRLYLDLGSDIRATVEITQGGWGTTLSSLCPVKFRRSKAMLPLMLPASSESGDLSLLRKYIPFKGDEDFVLVCAWLVASLWPSGPYPILVITGEQGSGKSTASEIIRSVIDPSRVPTRAAPGEDRDLVVAAHNTHVIAYDNISSLRPWLSDALCRLSTGGGFGVRKLYSDREEALFWAQRPIILNGIDDISTRGDMADRSIIVVLDEIEESERRTASELRAQFEVDAPLILAGVLNAAATALALLGKVELPTLPRMADFARLAMAAEPAIPVEPGTFERAYTENRQTAAETVITNDCVATALVDMMESADEAWYGTMGQLMEDLKRHLPDPEKPPRDYPKSARGMGSRLRRVLPALKSHGIKRIEDSTERSRSFFISSPNE